MLDQPLELESRREEVKQQILALKARVPFARIFGLLGKAFEPNSLGYWLSIVALLNLLLVAPALMIGLALREMEVIRRFLLPSVLAAESLVFGLIVVHWVTQYILDDLANQIIGHMTEVDDLNKLWRWLEPSWSTRRVVAVALVVCPFSVLGFVIGFSNPLQQFVGLGFTLASGLAALLASLMYYAAVWTLLAVAKLRQFRYEMNAFCPADSQVLSDISDMVSRGLYMLAAYFAVVTLLFTSRLIDEQLRSVFAIPILATGWTFIAARFLLTRSTLEAITNRAKWMTLNRLRGKINALEATDDLSDKDTAERLLRLADLHTRVVASKTHTLDFKSVTTLLSQLMLPLLGLLLGNLDRIAALFRE